MKTFTFVYDPECSPSNSLKKMKETIKTGVPLVEENQIRSPSIKALLTIATENRLKMFRIIRQKNPQSLYELAQILGKDLGYISREIRVLESMFVVKLEKFEEKGRVKFKPVALYDRIVFDFGLD